MQGDENYFCSIQSSLKRIDSPILLTGKSLTIMISESCFRVFQPDTGKITASWQKPLVIWLQVKIALRHSWPWHGFLAQGNHIIPIPGTRHRKYLEENAGAVDVNLTSADMKDIETLLTRFPDIGSRYSENFAKQVDKE